MKTKLGHVIILFFSLLLFKPPAQAQDQCKPVGWVTQNGGVTGGGNASPTVVSNYNDLKSAITSSSVKMVHISGTITIPSGGRISFQDQSGKTIYGLPGSKLVSNDLTKDGSGILYVKRCSNIIFRNLTFEGPAAYDTDGWDNMTIDKSTNIWVDHCEFQDGLDGNLDIKNAADYISVTWCKFIYNKPPKAGGSGGSDDHRFSNLFGSSDGATGDRGKLRITLQNCWWAQGCKARMPRVRFGKVHVVNNYFNSTVSSSCVMAGFEADLLVESNVFENVKTPIDKMDNTFTAITSRNNIFSGTSGNTAGSGTAFTPPYSLTIASASQVKSMVTAGAGATLSSPNCGGNTNNPPTVSITSPSNNSSFIAPATITISANASDADGSVSKVEFYNGNSLLGSDASSPYSFTWSNVSAGTYTITAKATDNAGAVTTSAAISIKVNAAVNQPPLVSISSPSNNATYAAPATITISANASDADGSVSKVEFYNGSSLLGSDASSPYSFTWSNVSAGTYTITAKATDNAGAVTTSASRTIIVIAACTPTAITPYIRINGGSWNQGSSATLTIGDEITFGPQPTTGGSWNWQGPNGFTATTREVTLSNVQTNMAGNYTATYTNQGGCTSTGTFTITVSAPNQLPVVTISSPANNSSFSAPATITFTATASDADGTVNNVAFYNGNTLLGNDATSPYNFTWNNISAGTYSITAKATDNDGAVTTSSVLSVSVNTVSSNTVTIQGETACSVDGILSEAKNAGFRGTGYVNTDNETGTSVQWAINSQNNQAVSLSIRYANESSNSRNMSLEVNGITQLSSINFPSTGSWTNWNTTSVQINLSAGYNTIRMISLMNEGGPNLDELVFNSDQVSAASCTPPPADCNGVPGGTAFIDDCGTCVGGNTGKTPCVVNQSITIQAETACLVDGIADETKNGGYNGNGYVNTDNETGTSISWNINSGTAQSVIVSFRYANESSSNRKADIKVNGITQASGVDFISTRSWTSWNIVNVSLNLISGNNSIQMTAITSEGAANIDELTFNAGNISSRNCNNAKLSSLLTSGSTTSQATIGLNPTETYFTLSGADDIQSYIILDQLGQIQEKGGYITSGNVISIGSDLNPGNYILQIQYVNGKIETRRLVKN